MDFRRNTVARGANYLKSSQLSILHIKMFNCLKVKDQTVISKEY